MPHKNSQLYKSMREMLPLQKGSPSNHAMALWKWLKITPHSNDNAFYSSTQRILNNPQHTNENITQLIPSYIIQTPTATSSGFCISVNTFWLHRIYFLFSVVFFLWQMLRSSLSQISLIPRKICKKEQIIDSVKIIVLK